MSAIALAQSAVCPASHAHALFLSMDLRPNATRQDARHVLHVASQALDAWRKHHEASRACWAIGIGSEDWGILGDALRPSELASFPQFADAAFPNPHTPHALFLHLRSERHDLCFEAGQIAEVALEACFTVAESVAGFRYLDSRDLTGFVDGTENPELGERPDVALIDEPGMYAGGSYLHVQRYVHDLHKWQHTPVATQEHVIGRTKVDDIELSDDEKPDNAHIARVVIEEDGEELAIVRQSLPYGNIGGEQGLFFVSYCKTPTTFAKMLARMMTKRDGHSDNLLHFTRAATGAAYFVPPRAWFDKPA
ncbi:MAG: Dyp-type peroxidase [Burkholderiales bacterium]|nr:Dyp-type peroxidase [Burkholderiales bacterium]